MAKKAEKAKEEKKPLQMFTTYETAEDALQAIKNYFQRCEDNRMLCGEASMAQGIQVSLNTLRGWYDGKHGEDFAQVAQWAYQEIASMLETNPQYCQDKVLSKRGWSLMKQPRFQAYQDKTEEKIEHKVSVTFGKNMDKSCFE